jgi:hypothetical protein
MNIAGRIGTSFVFASIAVVGFATPAWADDFSGTYTINTDDGNAATWVVTPCDGDFGQQPFVQCVHVTETGGAGEQWEADAHWQVGWWTTFVERPDAIVCDDGRTFPGSVGYSWDAATLSGWVSGYYRGVCEGPRGNIAAPFALTKTGPAGPSES